MLVAIAISLLVNGVVLTEMAVRWKAVARAPAPPREVALAPLSAAEWAANRAVQGRSESSAPMQQRERERTPPPSPPRQTPGQVVEVAPSKDETPPKDSRFVSDRNNTVEKETRARDARAGAENTLPKPSSPKVAIPSPPAAKPPASASTRGDAGRASEPRQGGEPGARRPARTVPSDAARERLALVPQGELRNPLKSTPAPPASGDAAEAPGSPRRGARDEGATGSPGPTGPLARLDLRPSASAYDRLAGGPAPDHLEGVEEGEGTYLNTREWKYAGYFNRIKQAVASQWDPGPSMAARDPTGARFGEKDWQTLVIVRLDGGGSLKKVSVTRASGLDFLDRLALDAFQKAQPFTNPPAGLADEHGEIVFTFGFYVEMGGSGLRIFRSPIVR